MFSTLTSNYFSKEAASADREQLSRQILLLSLVALNFQDVPIQLRPLFEDLDRQLTQPEDKRRLREVAQEVATRQAFRLTVGGGYNSGPRTVKSGDVLEIPELLATVTVESVGKDSIRAYIDSKFAAAGRVGPFNVGYFVWPITDNTKLGELRVCVLLLNTAGQQATIRVIGFGSELAADRFDIKELSRALRDKRVDPARIRPPSYPRPGGYATAGLELTPRTRLQMPLTLWRDIVLPQPDSRASVPGGGRNGHVRRTGRRGRAPRAYLVVVR